jgi:hypothetical protein
MAACMFGQLDLCGGRNGLNLHKFTGLHTTFKKPSSLKIVKLFGIEEADTLATFGS